MELSKDTKNSLARGFPFAERTGVELIDLAEGYVRMQMPYESNANHIGTMYAGALFTLAELPGGIICFSSFDMTKYYPIVKDMQIRFRRPAKSNVTVELRLSKEKAAEITAITEAEGKADYILEGELVDAEGTVVALSKGVYQLRKKGR